MSLTKLRSIAEEKKSRIILALDYKGRFGYQGLLEMVEKYVAGVKIGYPALFDLGPSNLKKLISSFRERLFFIADFKIADIPAISREIASRLRDLGFEAAIVHAVAGADTVRAVAEVMPAFALVAMTHRGASVINTHVEQLIEFGVEGGASGYVAPATYPEIVSLVRREAPGSVIISPGVGAQGGGFGGALKAGADFEIIGRAITLSTDPEETALRILSSQREATPDDVLA